MTHNEQVLLQVWNSLLVLPEPAAAGCHVANDEDYNVLPQYCKTPCYYMPFYSLQDCVLTVLVNFIPNFVISTALFDKITKP